MIIDQINLRKIKDEVLHCFNETEQYLAMGDELLLTHLDTFGTHNIQNSDFFHLRCSLIDLSLQESEVTMTLNNAFSMTLNKAFSMKQYRI